MARSKTLKSMEAELEKCGFPRDPASIVGRKFRLTIREAVREGLKGRYRPYILFGCIVGIDYFLEMEIVHLYVSPNITGIGEIDHLWLSGKQQVGITRRQHENQYYIEKAFAEEHFGQLILL